MTEKRFKSKLIQDYERYIKMYNRPETNKVHAWKYKYISLIVYIGDLFSDLFGEDIDYYTDLKVEDD